MSIFKIIPKLTQTNLAEMADVVGVTHDPIKSVKDIEKLQKKIIHILTTRGVKDHAKVIEDHPVEQEKPPKYLFEIKESSCFGRLFDARDPYCNGKCGFAQDCVETLERLALQVAQGQPVLARSKKGRSIMALKKPETKVKEEKKATKVEAKPAKVEAKKAKAAPVEEAPKKKKAAVEEEAPKKTKKAAPVEEPPKKKKAKEEAPVEEAPKKKAKKEEPAKEEKPAKGAKGGTAKAEKKVAKKALTPFGEGRFFKVIVEKNPLQKKDVAYDLAGTLVEMSKSATKGRLTQEQFFKAIEQHFVLPEDEAKAVEQIKEVAEEMKQKAVGKIIRLGGE